MFGLEKILPHSYGEVPDTKSANQFIDELKDPLEARVRELGKEMGLDPKIPSGPRVARFYAFVASFKGDNTMLTANTPLLGLIMMVLDEFVLGMPYTLKDVNFSSTCHDGGEDILLLPLNMLTHPTIQREFGAGHIPTTSDVEKMILLNPARKQSSLDTEITSKIKPNAKRAEWTNPGWITYVGSQIALMYSYITFDNTEVFQSPALYQSEGGCAGRVPFKNRDTARSLIFHQNRGTSTDAIYGIMYEAAAISSGTMKPKNTTFLPFVYQIQSGSDVFLRSASMSKEALKILGSKEEVDAFLKSGLDDIPPDVQSLAVEYDMSEKLAGTMVRALINSGHMCTEMEIRLAMASAEKNRARKGTVPMQKIIEMTNRKADKIRSQSVSLLSTICGSTKDPHIRSLLDAIPKTRFGRNCLIHDYWASQELGLTSLMYQPTLRLYPSYALDYITTGKAQMKLNHTIVFNSDPLPKRPVKTAIPDDEIRNWLDAVRRGEKPIPPYGLASRDGDIMKRTFELAKAPIHTQIVLITSDRSLQAAAYAIAKMEREHAGLSGDVKVWRISANRFGRHCQERTLDKIPPGVQIATLPSIYGGEMYYTLDEIREVLGPGPGQMVFLLDEPNITRTLGILSRTIGGFSKMTGFLTHDFVKNHPNWGNFSIESLRKDSRFHVKNEPAPQWHRNESLKVALLTQESHDTDCRSQSSY